MPTFDIIEMLDSVPDWANYATKSDSVHPGLTRPSDEGECFDSYDPVHDYLDAASWLKPTIELCHSEV